MMWAPLSCRSVLRWFVYQRGNIIRNMGRNCRYLHLQRCLFKGNQDFLLQDIKHAENPFSVLEIVGTHQSVMNNAHVMQALKSLFEFKKSKSLNVKNDDLICSPEFVTLCKRLKSQARALQLNEVIEALKIILYVGAPSDSDIVNVLLQLITHNVNDLNLSRIIFVDFLLDKCASSPLRSALKLALPIVFDTHLQKKFDDGCDSVQIAAMLHYAIDSNLRTSSVDFLLKHLGQKTDTIDAKCAFRIVKSLLKLRNLSSIAQELLPQMLKISVLDISNVPLMELQAILTKLAQKYSIMCTYYYNEDYFTACARSVIHQDYGLEEGTKMLRKLSKVGHLELDLLNYLGEKVMQKPEDFINSQLSVVLSLISGFSKANYVPPNWKFISSIVIQHSIFSLQMVYLPWIKFALELASLDCFHSHLINFVFEESFLRQFLAREKNHLDYIQLLNLYQAVVTLMPDYAGSLPPADIIEKAISLNGANIEDFPLQAAVEHGVGGSTYVHTKVYTKFGHFIDHAVVIRRGGFPVAINLNRSTSSRFFIEDIELPNDCKMLLILCLKPNCYAINCNRLKGTFALNLKTLKALNYGVIPISLKSWHELLSNEKIPYIMRAINSTYDELCTPSRDSL